MRRRQSESRTERSTRREALAAVADRFKAFRPAREVLSRVRAVPTIFPQFDHATKVGGLPIERFMLVHGPSNHGKTVFTMGLLASFAQRDHFALLVDAERTTPITWVEAMSQELATHPGFYALRPRSYEDTVKKVREFLTEVKKLKEEGKVPKDTSALVVVDSIRKLVPEGILAKILKAEKGAKGIDGMGGRAAQIKAAMNSAWMDELVPILEDTGSAFVAIARETEDPDADMWQKKAGNDFKIGGGKAIYYDASLVMRVERAAYVQEAKGEDETAKRKVFGERHRVTIRKTKVAGREDKMVTCHFHTSNGVLVPEGFDRARDVLELGLRLEVVKKKGSWLTWSFSRWQGEHAAVRKLHTDSDLLQRLELAVREKFAIVKPIEHDEDGVIDD